MARQTAITRGKKDKALKALKQNRPEEAIRLLTQACRSAPGDAAAWRLLASAQGRAGNFPAVLACCAKAIALDPMDASSHSILGNAQVALGHHQAAFAAYREALRLLPDDAGILNNLGMAQYLAGDLQSAAETLARVVQLRPDYADAHNNLGNIHKALHQVDEAIHHFQRALDLNPRLLEAWLNLGDIFSDRVGHPVAAEACFRHAVALQPGHREALCGLANMLRFQGRLAEAGEILQTLLHHHPDDIGARATAADILERQGQHAEAHDRVRALLAREGGGEVPLVIDLLLRLCRRHGCCEEAVDRARALLDGLTLSKAGRQLLHFSLGKHHDRLGQFEQAFEHYRQGNETSPPPHDAVAFTRRVDDLVQAYRAQALAQLPRSTLASRRPLFIVGMPRSGTSLTEQILASHPKVFGAGELNEVNDLAAGLPGVLGSEQPYPQCLAALTQETVDRLTRRYLDKLATLAGDEPFVTDKMPHNFLNLGLIALLFPQARVIHCVRDPRDTCLSIYFQHFGWLHPYGADLAHLGRYYRDYRRLMEHWQGVLELPMLTVRYEDLVADQENTTRGLLDFCGLEWDDRCLRFHESERVVATASYDQVRQKIYTRSRSRWKHYAPHLAPLVETLGDGAASWPPSRSSHAST